MKEGWEIKKLVELSKNKDAIVSGPFGSNLKVADYKDVGVPIFRLQNVGKGKFINKDIKYISDEKAEELKYHSFKAGDLVLAKLGIPIGKTCIVPDEFSSGIIVADVVRLRPDKNVVDYKFLEYFLNSDEAVAQLTGNISGATRPRVNLSDVRGVEIDLPPLPEQQRIVSILDQAFTAIDKAKANAEQNLQNAKELFESFSDTIPADKVKLGSIITIKTGKLNANAAKEDGDYPFFTCSREVFNIDNYAFDQEAVLLAGNNASGDFNVKHYKGKFNAYQRTYVIAAENDKMVSNKYLYYQLRKSLKEFKRIAIGANTRFLKLGMIQNLQIPLPSYSEQMKLVQTFDSLLAETQELEAVYQKKMDDLEELKKSILQKAFAGELTSSVSTTKPITKVIPLQKVDGISPTDLQAGITALALQKHIEQNKQHSFHHVKAEKIVHLSEYILNIDLNRNPVKDAAGPNDFPHAKKVESRARKAGFYSVHKNGDYYDYRQGNSFNKVIEKAQNSLKEKADNLSQIIDILAPMSTQHAEVVATVYAAWNNLLLTKKMVSDEDIVTEARENWHENKLAIERDKFFSTLKWMRKHELLLPKGNGKVVETKLTKNK